MATQCGYAQRQGFISRGGDLEVQKITLQEAYDIASQIPGCVGFTRCGEPTAGRALTYFKDHWDCYPGPWTSYQKEVYTEHQGYIPAGKDIAVERMTVKEACDQAAQMPGCAGFCYKGPPVAADQPVKVFFKDQWQVCGEGWTSCKKEGDRSALQAGGGRCNRSILKRTHDSSMQRSLQSTQAVHADIRGVLRSLDTQQFQQISRVEVAVVGKDSWDEWVDTHADTIMGGHPATQEARVFQAKLITSMKGMKTCLSTQKESEIVDLDYASEGSGLVFGYVAVSHLDKEKNDMHVVLSGYGNKFELASGQSLNKKFMDDRKDDLRAYCRHGALKQIKRRLDE